MKSRVYILVVLFSLSCNTKVSKTDGDEQNRNLSVCAAAGARTAIEEVSGLFCRKDSFKIEANYASSGTLARQIANGAECDVYISANKQWIDYLLEKDIIEKSSVHVIAKTSLVVIAPMGSKLVFPEFSFNKSFPSNKNSKIAIGNPEFVPVGKYAKMVFDTLGWFNKVEPNLVMCKDVSSVRHYVELGECDWGIVYYTEAIQSKKLRVVSEIPKELYMPIYFYIALTKNGNQLLGEKYIETITDSFGQMVMRRYGFTTVVE